MNLAWTPDGVLSCEPPVATPGSYVSLRGEMRLVIAFSAWPRDVRPINGVGRMLTEAHFLLIGGTPRQHCHGAAPIDMPLHRPHRAGGRSPLLRRSQPATSAVRRACSLCRPKDTKC